MNRNEETGPTDSPLAVTAMAPHGGHFCTAPIRSGIARALIVQTGPSTHFGGIAARLRLRPPETEFERGLRHFGNLFMTVALVLVVFALSVNVHFARPVIQSLLFAIALAVGLSRALNVASPACFIDDLLDDGISRL